MLDNPWDDEEFTQKELDWLLSIKEWEKNQSEKISETLLASEKIKLEQQKKQIKNIASILFNTKDWLTNACYYTNQPKESSDWAILYTIIKTNDNKYTLIKVWAWEFNTELFNQENINSPSVDYKNIKWFSRTPVPLFVVNQEDSYFANEEQKLEKLNNPQKYLENHSVIVVPQKKQAYIKTKNNTINFNDIKILSTDDVIKQLQTALLESKFSEQDQKDIAKNLKDRKKKDIKNFKHTITYRDKHDNSELYIKLIYLLRQIIPESWNLEQIYNLLQNNYNEKKNIFE